jgi:hypothetical protein
MAVAVNRSVPNVKNGHRCALDRLQIEARSKSSIASELITVAAACSAV